MKREHEAQGSSLAEMLDKMNRYWRAANYLCIGQIYLFDNPLLRSPLKAEQIKPRLLGHWGTSPGQNFIYIHLNRLIKSMMRTSSTFPVRGTEVHRSMPAPIWKAPTPRFTRRSRTMKTACGLCSQVLDAGRCAQPLRAARTEFDARRRGAWLFSGSRIRRGLR